MKSALGRGLDALINPQLKDKIDAPVAISSKELPKDDGKSFDILTKIPVNQISPNPYQPRTVFEPEALEELKKSILENGLIQPITVRRVDKEKYELISGERRLRACKEIGIKEIPAYIIKVDTKEAMLALSLIENIQREKLNPIEVANAYKRLMDECNLSQEEIAKRVGKDRTTITNFIRLLKLPEPIQKSLIENKITTGHARALINLPSEAVQLEIHEKIIKKSLSVRKVEELVRKYLESRNGQNKKKSLSLRVDLANASQRNLEEKLQSILGTKVHCKINNSGAGQIVIEFYSQDELERLLELFEIINANIH
ncbi:MAG: ParB/RepB/Spo0J family partition protein [Melioribacter sp.]|uniref:ParB/RepB/Spo0J family partition protein n=1 Tax=Rosettibacter primus TaxID=3111523 RepID=UPI00247C3A20|nr:ParB/RepB/Spo0J family partition protein [Melioribacter sp.]